ncbi:MAG TPA: glycoside hydrolase family 9 protein, partial [Polyangiaceae bacterium]|nr:glycoside hydrolase family 9 protein [Polyangiaceae bacterium]
MPRPSEGHRNIWLLAALALTCSDRPPRAATGFGGPKLLQGPGAGAPSSSSTGTPGEDTPTDPYPASPQIPPPVAPPAGQGLGVQVQPYIVVDQFGYRTKMTKVAILVDPARGWNAADSYQPGPALEVRRWSDGKSVWQGKPVLWKQGAIDEASGDRGSWLDFSALATPGTYFVFDTKNELRSHPFEVGDDVYKKVLKAAARMYYFNRANVAKKPPYSCVGKRCWSVEADYVGPGQDREARSVKDRQNGKTARDLSGGWWDAGDTNKYVTFTLDPVHQLLTAYEEHPQAFGDDFDIPESGNGVPDLLDELSVELDWLKKMQPPDLQGGALVKVGVTEYGDPMPESSRLGRFYDPAPCSAATIAVAGEFAHAALVLKGFPRTAAGARELGERAVNAWKHFHANPKSDQCDDGTIKSGDADRPLDQQNKDAVLAAIYLFALTGQAEFGDYVVKNYASMRPFGDDRWSVYDQAQGDALLFYAALPNADAAAKRAILERKTSGLKSADFYGFRPELDLYRAYMRLDSYHWGSNNQRAAFGNTNYDAVRYQLLPAAELGAFEERAAGMLHSFHGVNPMQLVYLTNLYAEGGDACVDEIYHAWFRDGDPTWDNARSSELGPAPGYVPGGPNQQYCSGQDPNQMACAHSAVRAQPPGKAYVDANTGWAPQDPYGESWELSEPAIYYQA